MITESTVYWITRCDGLRVFCGAFSGIMFLVSSIALFFHFIDWADSGKKFKYIRLHILSFLVPVLVAISMIFIPSTKEMCAILIIPQVFNDKSVQELPKDFVNLAHEWTEELRPENKKGE